MTFEQLHPEVLAMLKAQADAKPRRDMSVQETRAAMRANRRWQREPAVPIETRDESANGVPVRLYSDPGAGCLLYFHGGRFFSGDLETHDWACREMATLSGVAVCAVDYRPAPEHPYPAALEDARTAVDWLQARASHMAVGGDSAGGYLAPAPHEFTPATLMITADWDPLCDEGMNYSTALKNAAVPLQHWHFADMPHGFFTQTKLTRAQELMKYLSEELKSAMRAP